MLGACQNKVSMQSVIFRLPLVSCCQGGAHKVLPAETCQPMFKVS
jgi:hypothetical protein